MPNSDDHFGYGRTPMGWDGQSEKVEASSRPKGDSCPLTANLIEFALGRLNHATGIGKEIEEHLSKCPRCEERVDGLQRAAKRLPESEMLIEQTVLADFVNVPRLNTDVSSPKVETIFRRVWRIVLNVEQLVHPVLRPAVAFPLVVALMAATAWSHNVSQQSAKELASVQGELILVRSQLEQLGMVAPDAVDTPLSFQSRFRAAQEVGIQLDEVDANSLTLRLNDNLRQPYFDALRVIWDWNPNTSAPQESEVLYNWRSKPLMNVATKRFDPLPADDSGRLATVKLMFFPTRTAIKELQLEEQVGRTGGYLEKTFTVFRSRLGVTVPTTIDGGNVVAAIASPRIVGNLITAELQATAQGSGDSRDSVIHVLARATDGADVWKDRYYILPIRLHSSDLAGTRATSRQELRLSAEAFLGSASPDEQAARPKRIKILVVELPFSLQGWYVPKRLLDLEGNYRRLVLDSCEIDIQAAIGPPMASRNSSVDRHM